MPPEEPLRFAPASVVPSGEPGVTTLGSDDGDLALPGADGTPPGSASVRPGPHPPLRRELTRGESFGRYVVVSRLGQGGMSVVYVAYDPELDRKVALKLLLERREDGPVARIRLLREAQALAKLAHPNVVAVHDVGTVDGRVYLAMELVVGRTLDAWLAEAPRRWGEVLAAFVPAGQGLAAAHAVGLVHRDFKPENVMLGDDGRVRVMDFGLARVERSEPLGAPARAALESAEVLSAPLTRTGALLGTPRYMAPEQWRGEPTDARSDQFAYCVSLWEALHGKPPFAGKTVGELADRVLRGIVTVPGAAKVPAWLRRIVRRGLAVDPAERWPSMQALLEAFERGRARQRLRRGLAGLGAVGLVGLAALGWGRWSELQRARACERAGEGLADVWNDEARETLHARLLATGAGSAEAIFERTTPWIDAWAAEWSEARTQVCTEAEVEGTRPAEEHARAVECFEERRDELAGLLEGFDGGDRSTASAAIQGAAGLSPLAPCRDPLALARRPALPADPAARERLAALRRELWRVYGLNAAGRYPEGLAAAESVLAAAETLGYVPLTTRAWAAVGRSAMMADAHERAEAALRQAYAQAGADGDDELAASAATNLVKLQGVVRARPEEGLVWAESAAMLVRRAGTDEGLQGEVFREILASLHITRGAFDEARVEAERAVAIAERELGPEHPAVAPAVTALARAHDGLKDHARATPLFERAVAVSEATLGPEHPSVAIYLTNLAVTYKAAGEVERARQMHERALRIFETSYGPESYPVGASLNNVAAIHSGRGELDEALSRYERARAIFEETQGADHPDVGSTLINIAIVHARRGDDVRARQVLEQAIGVLQQRLGPDHPLVTIAVRNLATVLERLGELDAAGEQYERADAIAERTKAEPTERAAWLVSYAGLRQRQGRREQAFALYERARGLLEPLAGPDGPNRTRVLLALGVVAVEQGRAREAIPLLEESLASLPVGETEDQRPTTQLALARALAAAPSGEGGDRERARTLAEEARAGFLALGPAVDAQVKEAEELLRTLGG